MRLKPTSAVVFHRAVYLVVYNGLVVIAFMVAIVVVTVIIFS